MIYMVGGAPRTGKSLFARKILQRKNIPYISTDVIFHMLKDAVPGLGITDKIPHEQKAKRFFSFLKQLVKHIQNCEKNYVIEGDSFLPEQVNELAKEYTVKTCFFGFSIISLESIKKHEETNKWTNKLTTDELHNLPQRIIKISDIFKKQSGKYNFPYFDLSVDYDAVMEKAYSYLFPT